MEGLLTAVDNIDEIVHIIRSSQDDAEAKKRMNERFGLDEIQGEAILQMRLRRLTGLARQDLVDEISQLRLDIAYYEDLLAHEEKILAVIADELVRFPTVTLTSVVRKSPTRTSEPGRRGSYRRRGYGCYRYSRRLRKARSC